MGSFALPWYPLSSQTLNLPERPPESMLGDIPSGWAFGRMGRTAIKRPNSYSGLVDGLSADELELLLVMRTSLL